MHQTVILRASLTAWKPSEYFHLTAWAPRRHKLLYPEGHLLLPAHIPDCFTPRETQLADIKPSTWFWISRKVQIRLCTDAKSSAQGTPATSAVWQAFIQSCPSSLTALTNFATAAKEQPGHSIPRQTSQHTANPKHQSLPCRTEPALCSLPRPLRRCLGCSITTSRCLKIAVGHC